MVDIKVSKKNSIPFYIKTGRNFLHGTKATDEVEAKPANDEIVLTALGDAINIATSAAARIEEYDIGKITRIVTDYPDMSTSDDFTKGVPQLKVTIQRNPDYVDRKQ